MVVVYTEHDLFSPNLSFESICLHSFRGDRKVFEQADLVFYVSNQLDEKGCRMMKILKNRYPDSYLTTVQFEAALDIAEFAEPIRNFFLED